MSNHPIVCTWRARIAASGQQNDPTDHTEFARGWVAAMEHAEVALVGSLQTTQETLPEVRALVETAQWARNRLEIIADEAWHGDGRDLKRSIIGIFADFDKALADCGSEVPPALRGIGEGE